MMPRSWPGGRTEEPPEVRAMSGWQFSRLCSGILCALLIVVACAPAASPPAATQAPAKPAEAAKPAAGGAQIKLSFIGVESDDQKFALSAVLAEYQKTRPDVTVDFE